MESRTEDLRAKIAELLQPLLADGKYFVVDLRVSDSRAKIKITVLLDSDAGISIDECATISRRLGQRLEELNWIENAYTLEVSSPGVDFPLTLRRQYPRHVGRTLVVSLRDGSTRTGRLDAVTDDHLMLLEETLRGKKKVLATEPTAVPFAEIDHSQVLISFR
jgi:ribosome maturation factor RimP